MTSKSRFRSDQKNLNGMEEVTPEVSYVTEPNEDEVVCCCFKSKSKTSVKSDVAKKRPEEQGKPGIENEHSNGSNKKAWSDHHTETSSSPRLDKDQQDTTKKITYKERDHLKETKNGTKQLSAPDQGNSDGSPGKRDLSPPTKNGSSLGKGHPWPTDWENNRKEGNKYTGPSPGAMPKSSLRHYSSEDEKQKSGVEKEEVNNESHGGTWSDLKEKGNNGSNGGARSDPTKKSMSSTFGHAGPPPWKEKEKAIGSTAEKADSPQWKKKEKAIASTFEPADPPQRKEKESNLPKHSYEDPYKDQHKDVHKGEYNQEKHKNTRQDLTKKESSSPEQSVEPKRKGKQNETNRLGAEEA